ncbi:VOC family protein [Bacillus pinisoli]|uniref:VOC family protein n=1 Tax=Bacillus pinisoli TaxID=2901866 RepID=UPI001FF4EF56|nr:VOC family protein [Bacillus pinisoli]
MGSKLIRVGTTYLPVKDVKESTEWYVKKLRATLSYQDETKSILNLANQSIFLVKSREKQNANFIDSYDNEHFSITFEVDGLECLHLLHQEFKDSGMIVGEIESRGHAGQNFVFQDLDGNIFDVWSQLSPIFKEKFMTL